jgi:hypothetical protein
MAIDRRDQQVNRVRTKIHGRTDAHRSIVRDPVTGGSRSDQL